ncbi:MAG: DUF302 domain-containing protein [Anaerolineales bacterium]|jgi:uncharacterized protein (DUF302 family)
MTSEIGFEVNMQGPFEVAVEKVKAALKEQGFGVLTQIDVKATMKEKLDEDFRPYIILGACNPHLAHKALSTDPVVGVLLPCNVTVEENPQGDIITRIVNPEVMMTVGTLQENQAILEVAQEARTRLENVARALIEA